MHCFFCGHSEVVIDELLDKRIRCAINSMIDEGVHIFYCGFCGKFDFACADIIREYKSTFSELRLIAVTPYILPSYKEKNDYMVANSDEIVYPPLESVPYRFAITRRNEWMADNSDYVLAYVNHTFGGAYSTLHYAKRKRLTIVNLS